MKPASCVLVAAALASLPALAETRRERVTDPAELVAFGFAADATRVWRIVDDELPRERPTDVDGVPAGRSFAMTGDDFRMASTSADYGTEGYGYLYCPSGSAVRVASATVDVPAGHRLAYLDLWGTDDSTAEDLSASLIATCHTSDAAGSPNNFVLAEVDSAGLSGDFFQDTLIPEHFANPEQCAYAINLVFGDGFCEGTDLMLQKVRVSWSN